MNCSKDIVVNGTRFGNGTYTVTVNKSAVGKIISDPNLSAEKISVLDNIEDVVGNANYVGSGEYVSHGSKNKSDVSRYDYFETEVSINGKEYIVSFDVEVHPNVNNYRTHKVINEINLTSSPDMGPLPTADNLISTNTGDSSSLFNNSIPNSGENVNANQKKRSYNDTFVEKTDAPQELKNEFIDNPDMYTALSNADTKAKADVILNENSTDSALVKFRQLLDSKSPEAVPLGYSLSKKLYQEGRIDESVQLVRDMSRALTEAGQFSQAAAITMLNNDPEAAKRYIIRELDSLNQKGREKYGKKWTDFELTDAELQQFNSIEPGDSDAIKSAYQSIYNRISKQYPSTMTEGADIQVF